MNSLKNNFAFVAVAAFAVLALSFAVVTPVSAATDVDFLTLDGLTNATVEVGDSVDAKVTFDITNNDDVESLSWEVVGSGLPQTCVNIADRINSGTFNVEFPLDVTGATEGTWDVEVSLYGTNGSGANNNCEGSADDTTTFSDRLTVTEDANDDGVPANNTGNNGNNGNNAGSNDEDMEELLKLLRQLLAGGTVGGGAFSCAALNQKVAIATPHQYTQANTDLQVYVKNNGGSIPALDAGAKYGYYGDQTMRAVSQVKAAKGCN